MQGDNLKKLILAIALIILLLASCTTTKAAHSTNPVYVTNTKKVYLLPPEAMEGSQDNVQLLNGSFGEQTFGRAETVIVIRVKMVSFRGGCFGQMFKQLFRRHGAVPPA